MIVHKNWVVNLALSSVIAVTCAAGDKKLKSVPTSLKKVLLVDNAIHGIVGLFSVFITFMDHSDLFYLAIACMMISSLIDVDHFIAAKSLKLSVSFHLNYYAMCDGNYSDFRTQRTCKRGHFFTTVQSPWLFSSFCSTATSRREVKFSLLLSFSSWLHS